MQMKFKHCEVCPLVSALEELYESKEYADFEIEVGGERFPVHRNILCSRSAYFRDRLKEECQQHSLQLNVPLAPFKLLLKFIYTGKLKYQETAGTLQLLDIYALAHCFQLNSLHEALSCYFGNNLCLSNVAPILEIAVKLGENELVEKCFAFMDCNAKAMLGHSSFERLSANALEVLLSRATFYVPERRIIEALVNWTKKNAEANLERILENVRFSLMDLEFLVREVWPSGIIELSRLFEIMAAQFDRRIGPRIAPAKTMNNSNIFKVSAPTPEADTEIVHELEATSDIDFLCFKLKNWRCSD